MVETSEARASEVDAPPREAAAAGETNPPPGAALRGRSSRQYMLSLKSAFISARARAAPERTLDPQVVKALDAVFDRYEGEKANWGASDVWDDAFTCERLMVELYDDDMLGVELARRTLEMRDLNTSLAEFYNGRVQTPAADTNMLKDDQISLNRALLSRLIRDLQWEYNQQDLKRIYAREAQRRVVWTFIGALGVFAVFMFFTFNFVQLQAQQTAAAQTAAAPAPQPDEETPGPTE